MYTFHDNGMQPRIFRQFLFLLSYANSKQAGSNFGLWKFPSPFPFWKRPGQVILILFIVLLLYILLIYIQRSLKSSSTKRTPQD